MKKSLLTLLFLVFSIKAFSSAHLDRLTQAFDLMQLEKISAYDFGLSAVEYWDEERSQGRIDHKKYCLEIKGISQVIATESRKEEVPRQKKSIELFKDYLEQVKDFQKNCR